MNKNSKFVGLVSAVVVAVSAFVVAPAMAQSAPATETSAAASTGGAATVAATRGQQVVTTSGARLGRVVRVNNDGSIRVQVDGAINGGTARLPADTLSIEGENLVTSLTRGQVVGLVR